ncbi:MAG: iron-sulfur cluster assembly accessory protein [Pseudomonadota bacterium]
MSLITVTDKAAEHVAALMAKKEGAKGLRIGTKTAGCSGLMYDLEYVEDIPEDADLVELENGVKLFVDPSSVMYLLGTVMDWEEDVFTTGFTFKNPNESGRCGCGESFTV